MAHSIISVLNAYKEYIEKNLIKDDYKLAKAPDLDRQGIDDCTHVIPKVTTGCLPHANFSLYGAGNEFFQAPYILVGYEDAENGEEDNLSILIQVCCYSSSIYITDESDEKYELKIPDNRAFEDVTLLLEYISNILRKEITIAGTCIDKPISIGSYNSKELTYPYSFGYLRFNIKYSVEDSLRSKINY